VYDKYGMIDKNSIFSHVVFGKIATCVEAMHKMYMREGKVFNRRFNRYSQLVLISFTSDVQHIGMEEQVKLVWLVDFTVLWTISQTSWSVQLFVGSTH
jgi:hypothetical protein